MTAAHQRALVLGGLGALVAVVTRRVDVLVLATPVLVVASWGWLARPTAPLGAVARVGNRSLPEGSATRWTATVAIPPRADELTVLLSPGHLVTVDPRTDRRSLACPVGGGERDVVVAARPIRWGQRRVGPGLVAARSVWWSYRTPILEVGSFEVSATPSTDAFDAAAATPHPEGLVGVNRSTRPGTGSEFASIRPFQPGDRLRRIHWPSSLRHDRLQVRTTYTDEDAQVVLLVDAFSDLGPREGVDGRPTSLDVTVRAAAALARHYARAGDRVSLRVLGSGAVSRLPPGTGVAQHRRVLDVLARIEPATDRDHDTVRAAEGLVSGSLVVLLSPLVHPTMTGVVAGVAARGLPVVVVDTLPEHLWSGEPDVYTALAWRIRRLEREEELHRLRGAGVPVVPWRGPGSLDLVLRDLARRDRAPRLARR